MAEKLANFVGCRPLYTTLHTGATGMHTCQPPEYKNLEMSSKNLCIVKMSLKTMSRNNLRKSPKRYSKRPGDLMKNLETPGKTGRVGRHGDGAVVRELASYHCGLSLFVPTPRVFLRDLWFSSLHKNQHSKFQFNPCI